jgi:hypothetical protein
MKTLTAILLASGLAILNALSVSAQEQTPTIPQTGFPMSTMVTCDTSEKMADVIYNKYGEQPLATGKGSIFSGNGQLLVGTMTYWINAETRTFSLTITNGEIMCLVLMGNEFEPAPIPGKNL